MYEIEISNGMKSIDKEEWNTLVGRDYVECYYGWFTLIESFHGKESLNIEYRHILIKEKGELIGVLPCYLTEHRIYYYLKELLEKDFLDSLPVKIREFDCHIPYTWYNRFFCKNEDKKLFDTAVEKSLECAKESKANLYGFLESDKKIQLSDLTTVQCEPAVWMPPQWSSWNEFLAAQKGKRGKHMRYEYKKSVKMGIETEVTDDLKSISKEIYELYKNVAVKNKSFEYLPKNFFVAVNNHLDRYGKVILAKKKDKILGHLFYLENEYTISCKYAGLDYEEALDSYTYFRMIYDLIKMGIEKKKPIYMGKATYRAKIRRGFRVQRKYRSYKYFNPIVNSLIRPLFWKKNLENKKLTETLEDM